MPEIEGHTFPPYVYAEWPKFVRNSDGGHTIARSQEDVDEFLKDDPGALAAYAEDQRLLAEIKAEEEREAHTLSSLQAEIAEKQATRHADYAARHDPDAPRAAPEPPRAAEPARLPAPEPEPEALPAPAEPEHDPIPPRAED